MFDIRILKFLAHISDCEQAYNRIAENGFDEEILFQVIKEYVSNAVNYNKNLMKLSLLSGKKNAVPLGIYRLDRHPFAKALSMITTKLTGNEYFEVGLNPAEHISLFVETDPCCREEAEYFFQNILLNITAKFPKGLCNWKCIAGKDSGAYLGSLIKLVSADSTFGNTVVCDDYEISNLLSDIEKTIMDNITKSEGKNVYIYNESSEEIIPITNLIIGDISELSDSTKRRLSSLVPKATKSGINIFVIDESDKAKNITTPNVNVCFTSSKKCFKFNYSEINSEFNFSFPSKAVIESLLKSEVKSSRIEDNFDLNAPMFSMNADESIRVPFAIEKGKISYFELGDKAPHGVISGTTGSGKSVLLHTIIDMITYNYHPDDVEIWAVDYKAVEFGCYVRERTPHFKVIGQDNSNEFSFSLIDLIHEEYTARKKRFVETGVKNIKEYRANFGSHSIPRILIVIDEFHNLTQAIQNSLDSSYKIKLENLLKEMRAMGMSFLFCSQKIASGLTGLTDAGKDQIKARICMQHISTEDITETLSVKGSDDVVDKVKKFDIGQAMYKAGNADYKEIKVLYISDEIRSRIIKRVNSLLGNQFAPKKEIICKNSERYQIEEKAEHCLNKFLTGNSLKFDEEEIEVYPAAPTTLYPEFCLPFNRNASCNLLLVGNDDNMRESILFMSVCSLLVNPANKVFVNIVNTDDSDSKRLKELFEKLHSNRLQINFGADAVMSQIESRRQIKPIDGKNEFNLWYGLNKLKSKVHLAFEAAEETKAETAAESGSNPELELENLLDLLIGHNVSPEKSNPSFEFKSFEDYSSTLRNIFEYGPEYGYFNIVAYNNPKSFSKDTFLKLGDFDYRIGLEMSVDDSYTVFGTESFTKKADISTAVCYTGSKTPTTIRPYLNPSEDWIKRLNIRIN